MVGSREVSSRDAQRHDGAAAEGEDYESNDWRSDMSDEMVANDESDDNHPQADVESSHEMETVQEVYDASFATFDCHYARPTRCPQMTLAVLIH